MSLASWGVPARPVSFTQQQPDGTILTYRLCGDEFFHYYITEDVCPSIKIGVKCSTTKADYWTVFDDFRLLFFGEPQEDDTMNAIQDIPTAQPHTSATYDLQGRRIVGYPSHGVYVRGGRKIINTNK